MASTPTRIALVTGANKGIGFEIARGIARSGAHVLFGARDTTRGRVAADSLPARDSALFRSRSTSWTPPAWQRRPRRLGRIMAGSTFS
jgi:NAD(P)-dependent dehydrogenase (short-subunit alcohol dehydrogenase family)